MINYSINDEKLGTVNAGTFTSNAYPKEVYECLGFKCDYHFLKGASHLSRRGKTAEKFLIKEPYLSALVN